MNKRYLVLTTINKPNKALNMLADGCKKNSIPFIIIGDTKSPTDFQLSGTSYYDVEQQIESFPEMAKLLPTCHYSRKNIGYLEAIKQGALEIQETDDDNIPYDSFWDFDTTSNEVNVLNNTQSWCNVYHYFSDENIWPRGFPLTKILQSDETSLTKKNTKGLIYQGLADENPDVDAIYRLTAKLPINFQKKEPVTLNSAVWCPFNSQNTIFKKEAFALLYLPSYCSFRMTDIWRSFVAQRCLWEIDEHVIFHNSTVYQERNEHNLLKDFEDEIPGYLHNEGLTKALENCHLHADDMVRNLIVCYESLVTNNFIPSDELALVKQWGNEVERLI